VVYNKEIDSKRGFKVTRRGSIYTTIGLSASHIGLRRQAGAISLPGLHPRPGACGPVVRATGLGVDITKISMKEVLEELEGFQL
jgi:hypothetical protein